MFSRNIRALGLALALLAPLFAAGCGAKEPTGTPLPTRVYNSSPELTGNNSAPEYGDLDYRFRRHGCDTGYHRFATLEELCVALMDDTLNHSCAREQRESRFQERCSNTSISVHSQTSPPNMASDTYNISVGPLSDENNVVFVASPRRAEILGFSILSAEVNPARVDLLTSELLSCGVSLRIGARCLDPLFLPNPSIRGTFRIDNNEFRFIGITDAEDLTPYILVINGTDELRVYLVPNSLRAHISNAAVGDHVSNNRLIQLISYNIIPGSPIAVGRRLAEALNAVTEPKQFYHYFSYAVAHNVAGPGTGTHLRLRAPQFSRSASEQYQRSIVALISEERVQIETSDARLILNAFLDSNFPSVRMAAAIRLRALGENSSLIRELLDEALETEDPDLRLAAARLIVISIDSIEDEVRVINMIGDQHAAVREVALQAAFQIQLEESHHLDALVALLSTASVDGKLSILTLIAKIPGPAAGQTLLGALNNSSQEVRSTILGALATRQAELTAEETSIVTNLLSHENREIRKDAALALRHSSSEASSEATWSALIRLLSDSAEGVSNAAAATLASKRLSRSQILEVIRILNSTGFRARMAAAIVLGGQKHDPSARQALLSRKSRESDALVRSTIETQLTRRQ